nr:WYL domain-containing protein [Phytoactinopolyspora endophytica]
MRNMPARMLQMLSLMQSRREWSGGELAERLGVTERTIRRDVARLRELGYPVQGTTGTVGGYRLESGTRVPPLLLDDDEAVAIAVALKTAAAGVNGIEETAVRALVKLEQVLPARLRAQVATVGDAIVSAQRPDGPRADPDVLGVVATACRDNDVLTFRHQRRGDGADAARRVEPYSLVMSYDRWYLLAYDLHRDDWRTFRVDRINDATLTGRRFDPRELPAESAAAYVALTIAKAPYRYTLDVVVAAPAEAVTSRLRALVTERVEPNGDGTCTVRLGADRPEILAQRLVALDADFSVEGPSDVLEYLRSVGHRLIAATRAGDQGG